MTSMAKRLEVETVIPTGYEVQYEVWKLAPAVRVGDTLHCSGQLGLDPDGGVPGAGIEVKATAVRGAWSRHA